LVGHEHFLDILKQTRVLRAPRRTLSTFGSSEIHYNLVTAVSSDPASSTLRTGLVTASRPKILTRESIEKRFEGFGESAEDFMRMLNQIDSDAFRALEYNFQNRLDQTVPHAMDARELGDNIQKDLDRSEAARAAVILAPETGWRLSLMKFIVEETLRSFAGNVRELDEHGLFDPAQAAMAGKRREIETLFRRAAQNPSELGALGKALKQHGLFEEYQDRFFSLVRR
jgi:hypothetical protein